MRDVDSCSSFEKPLSKGNRELECVQLSQMEKERILSEQTSFHDFFEKKADRAFQGELRLRQDYLKRRLNRTEENGDCEMLILEE